MSSSATSQGTLLVLNAGSSSIKFAVYLVDGNAAPKLGSITLKGEIEGIGTAPKIHATDAGGTALSGLPAIAADASLHHMMEVLIGWLEDHCGGRVLATGHRVVLGGLHYSEPALVDDALLKQLRMLIPLAPMHQPRNLEPIEELMKLDPSMPQIACFDTAFHRTMPEVAQSYGLPRHLSEEGGKRFGFHGLSYEYISGRLRTVDPKAARGRTVVAHLGNGASMCAMVDGKSVATTMGFSPLAGIMMGTRPGELDPGILLWLMEAKAMSPKAVESMLYHDCGLKGVSGISSDMRDLLASSEPHAKEAVDLFCYDISRALGSLAAAAGGLDCLVFTAGIGENAPPVRQAVCRQSAWLGIKLDETANANNEMRISSADSDVTVLMLHTDEEAVIARHSLELLQRSKQKSEALSS